jgi:predicted nucleic acid-binding protein
MKIIIDANRIVAALVKQSTTRDILFDSEFEFLTPDYSISEINEHKEELQKKAKLTTEEFDLLLSLIFERITILPEQEYSDFVKTCKVCDVDDTPYLAACLATKAQGVWSHDPHLSKQDKAKVFTNIDLLNFSRSAKSDWI